MQNNITYVCLSTVTLTIGKSYIFKNGHSGCRTPKRLIYAGITKLGMHQFNRPNGNIYRAFPTDWAKDYQVCPL
jgi:hypothetical protein